MFHTRHILSAVAVLLLVVAGSVVAQTVWDGGAGTNAWGTANNWNPNGVPTGATDVTFNNSFVATLPTTITFGVTNRSANSLTFDTGDTLSIIGSGTRTLTLTSGAITRSAASSGSQGLAVTTLALAANGNFTINGTGAFSISAIVANSGGARSVAKNGTGTLVLSGANTFTGGLTVNAGTVGFGNNTAAGTGTLTLAGGTVYADSAARTLTNGVTVSGNFAVGGSNDLTLSGATALGAATRTVTVDNTGTTTLSGVVSSSGTSGITKAGAGTLVLSGANIFTGNITASAGTLQISSDGNLGNTANDLTLNGGTVQAAGSLTLNVGRVVTVGASGGTLDVTSGQTLTLGSATQLAGSGDLTKTNSGTLAISAGNTGYTGDTNLNGGVTRLATYDGLGTSTANTLTISNGAELEANFANATSNFQSNIVINDGTIRRTNNTANKSGFQNSTGSLTVNGAAQVIDQGGDNANGFLTLDGIINVNTGGSLTATASTVNDEVRFGGAQNINLAAGSTFATSGLGTVSLGSGSARTIVGQGTSTQESTLVLGATTTTANAGTKFQVNGSGTGGLRVQGTQAKVDSLVTDARLAATTGTGGTLTIAYTSAGSRTLGTAANLSAASSVVLGLESNGGTFTLGTAGGGTGDLANWGGLTVGANTTATFADNNVFGSTDSLTLLGGTLNLNNTIQNFGTLNVTANSIIDFAGSASTLNLTNFIIGAGVTLTIQNWQYAVDFFSTANWTGATYNTMGSSPMNQVVFSGFTGNQTGWDSFGNQIRPNVPEPSTYGALLLGALLGLFGLRRFRQQRLIRIPVVARRGSVAPMRR